MDESFCYFVAQMNIKRNSPDLFKILFDSAGEGLILLDQEGTIVLINPRMIELFGYEEEELIGNRIEILIPKRFVPNHEQHRASYMKRPDKRSMGDNLDLWGLRKDKTEFPLEVSLNHFEAEGERFVMALVTDVTIRKAAQDRLKDLNIKLEEIVEERTEELRQSQELYSTIARKFPNGTINIFDRKLNYIFVEGEGLYSLGITSELLVGTSYLDRVPEELKEDIKNKLKTVLRGSNQSFDLSLADRMYLMNAVGLRGESGTIDRILLVEQNITKQKQAEENIRHALVKEQELGELKSRFVSMASHEFRTPLSTILSSANLLRKYLDMDVSLEKQEKHLRRIKSSVKNLTGILNDFLSLDKLQEGKIEATPSHWNIKDLISDIVDEMSDVRKEGQEVVYSHSAGSEEVYLDQNVLRNVVINLLSNAIKYSAANQSVRLESSVKRKRLYLEVEDQGIGIPKAEQKHLFERFFRAKNAINLDGTGLGLNIVNKYLELLGGKITFESEEGKGTKFFVSIPIIE